MAIGRPISGVSIRSVGMPMATAARAPASAAARNRRGVQKRKVDSAKSMGWRVAEGFTGLGWIR